MENLVQVLFDNWLAVAAVSVVMVVMVAFGIGRRMSAKKLRQTVQQMIREASHKLDLSNANERRVTYAPTVAGSQIQSLAKAAAWNRVEAQRMIDAAQNTLEKGKPQQSMEYVTDALRCLSVVECQGIEIERWQSLEKSGVEELRRPSAMPPPVPRPSAMPSANRRRSSPPMPRPTSVSVPPKPSMPPPTRGATTSCPPMAPPPVRATCSVPPSAPRPSVQSPTMRASVAPLIGITAATQQYRSKLDEVEHDLDLYGMMCGTIFDEHRNQMECISRSSVAAFDDEEIAELTDRLGSLHEAIKNKAKEV